MSEAQGRCREAGSEGSVEQSREQVDKRASDREVQGHQGPGGQSGGCAVKAVGLTSGGLRRVRKVRTERFRKGRDRGAEVSRRHSSRRAGEGLNGGQG